MATANLQPLVDVFAVAYWFPSVKRKNLSLGRTGGHNPVQSLFGEATEGPKDKARCLPFARGRSGRATAHPVEILKP